MTAATAQLEAGAPPAAEEHPKKRNVLPYVLLAPGVLWLLVFFLVPIITAVSASVQTGSLDQGFALTWRWANYSDTFSTYNSEIMHSLIYSVACTVLCLLLGYPLAYFIAFRGGRWKNLLMALVIAPAFTSFLIRTIAWETILSDHGPVTRFLMDVKVTDLMAHVGLLTNNHQLLNSPFSVVFGMVYNFLIAGTLLTFIPAVGDYINAYMLGSPNTMVIGQVIENEALRDQFGYPLASAMGVALTVGTLLIVLFYVKRAGTEDLL